MKILYTGAFRFPAGDAAAARVLNVARLLRMLGHEVEFLSFGLGKDCKRKGENDSFSYEVSEDLNQKKFLRRLQGMLFRGHKAYKLLKKRAKKYDCVIVYNPALFFTIKLIRLCKNLHLKLVLDITEWYSADDFYGKYANVTYWLNEVNMCYSSTKICNVISITSFLNEHYVKSKNRIVLPPLVDLSENKWSQECDEVIVRPFSGITLIYAGSSANKKDRIDSVLEALTRVVNDGFQIRILLLGNWHKELEVKYAFCKNNVFFLGNVPQEKVPLYYKMSDFSVLVRDNTRKSNAGFSTKLVESIASGVPPILNVTSDIEHYLPSQSCVKLRGSDVESIVFGLKQVCTMPSEYRTCMKESIKEIALNHFDYRTYAKSMQVFVENLR